LFLALFPSNKKNMLQSIKSFLGIKAKPKVITIKNFYEEILSLAKQYGEDYIEVRVTNNTYHGISLDCYINNFTWFHGCCSIEECKQKLIDFREIKPKLSMVKDCEIELIS
jgi:hypothetical protein